MKKIAIVRDPLYLKHSNGRMHPENASRLEAINKMLDGFPHKDNLIDIPARDAAHEELQWVHTVEYIESIEMTRNRNFTTLDPDTSATPDSYPAALRAAGGVMEAVKAVLTGNTSSAFAFVRPPGHHAEATGAMGFCLFNNIAIGAYYAINIYDLKRVLIIDWDVHHGNGTANTFYNSDRVLYCSIHEYPHYPGTGRIAETSAGTGKGFTVNVPLGAGQRDEDYAAVFDRVFSPIAEEFKPELVLISAGFDAHESDPLADMKLTSHGFGRMTSVIMKWASKCCEGRIVLVLEGGYSLSALQGSISSVLQTLLEDNPSSAVPPDNKSGYLSRVIEEVISIHKPYWQSL